MNGLTLRSQKGTKLSTKEMDDNLLYLNTWEKNYEPAAKAGLAFGFDEKPNIGDTITIGGYTVEMVSTDIPSTNNRFYLNLESEESPKAWIEWNSSKGITDIIGGDDITKIFAKNTGSASNSISFSTTGEITYYDPYTDVKIDAQTHLIGGVDGDTIETNLISPTGNKKIDASIIENLVGITGTQYIYVAASGTPEENAVELQSAYDEAKTMSPGSSNIITVICGPGKYNFADELLTLDTDYINLVSLTGNMDVIIYSAYDVGRLLLENIYISASSVYIKGIDASLNNRCFGINNNLVYLICENCKGGDYSFRADTTSGTFISCMAGDYSFGCSIGSSFGFVDVATGTFTNCVAGKGSFGQTAAAAGTFTNCVAGGNSFGFDAATGTFTNCVAGDYSFGVNITSGIFTNCVAENGSFSSSKSGATGRLYFCRLNNGEFKADPRGAIYGSIDSGGFHDVITK